MWAATLPPGSWTPLSGEGSRDDGLRDEQRARDLDHRLAAVHRRPPQPLEGLVLGEAEARHQRALGALDHLAVLERLFELASLAEARDGEIERGRQLRGTQRLEQVGHDAGRPRPLVIVDDGDTPPRTGLDRLVGAHREASTASPVPDLPHVKSIA